MSRTAAHALLLLAAVFWGLGNVAQKTVLDDVGALTAVGLRCLVATAAMAPLVLSEARAWVAVPGYAASAARVGLLFAAALALQQSGYRWTSVTNASFLVNVCTVLTPFVAWVLLRHVPGRRIVTASLITLSGAWFMAGGGRMANLNPGDLLCLGSAVLYAVWTVALAHHAERFGRPFTTTCIQFVIAAAVFLPAGVLVEPLGDGAIGRALPELLTLGLVSTAAAFSLQTLAIRYTSASTAAVIVSGESLFGAVGAFLFLGERTSAAGVFGAVLIMIAILAVATAPTPAARSILLPARVSGRSR